MAKRKPVQNVVVISDLHCGCQVGLCPPDGVRLDIKLSHQDMASLVGSTRESITVALGELTLEGYVRLARRQVFIRDIVGLAASVDTKPPELGHSSARI